MSYNGSGTFNLYSPGNPVVTGTTISSTWANNTLSDIATGLSTAITKDGQTTPTANLPMGGFKLTGLGAGSTAGDSLRYEQLFTTSAVTLLGAMNWVTGANIASASTINLTTATGNAVHVTGTTSITAVTLGSGMWRLVIFDGALTLTHHSTNNNLPGGANITTAAGDRALYYSDGTTVYCIFYVRASTGAVPTKTPTTQIFTSGSGTYTTPAGAAYIRVRMIGGGGGGGAVSTNNGTAGGDTTFSTLTASGGLGGPAAGGGGAAGGSATGGDVNIPGGSGGGGNVAGLSGYQPPGGYGGNGAFGGGGAGLPASTGGAAATNSGGGGAGGGGNDTQLSGGGGGAGGYVEKIISSPAATYSYAVGAGGGGGSAGVNAGGNGAAGIIIVDEFYI